MTGTPLWLIPILPLAGFLLNGLVALIAGSHRAKKRADEWNRTHPSHELSDTHPIHGAHDAPDGDATDPSDRGAHGTRLPYAQRLFHGIVGVGSVGLSCVVAFSFLVPLPLA